jgi:hypothetical protein
MTQTTNYVPGMCNINPMEIRRRRMSGHIGLITTVFLVIIFVLAHTEWYFRIIIILPVFLSAIGYLQARNKFCVGLASAGQQHADNGKAVKITDKKSLDLDKLKTRTMNIQAFVIAIVVTVIVALIPLS